MRSGLKLCLRKLATYAYVNKPRWLESTNEFFVVNRKLKVFTSLENIHGQLWKCRISQVPNDLGRPINHSLNLDWPKQTRATFEHAIFYQSSVRAINVWVKLFFSSEHILVQGYPMQSPYLTFNTAVYTSLERFYCISCSALFKLVWVISPLIVKTPNR